MRGWYCVIKCDGDVEASVALWEDHFLKPSTCPHAAEMGVLREAARDNIKGMSENQQINDLQFYMHVDAPQANWLIVMVQTNIHLTHHFTAI